MNFLTLVFAVLPLITLLLRVDVSKSCKQLEYLKYYKIEQFTGFDEQLKFR